MWKAKVTKTKEEFGINKVTVEYSKDLPEETFEETYQLTEVAGMKELTERVKKRILELSPVKPIKIKVGVIDLSEEVITPTPEQSKKVLYQKKVDQLEEKQHLVNLGVLQDSELTTLRTEVKQLATELGKI